MRRYGPALALTLASCSAIGPTNVARDRFDYNRVIGESNNEQMLLNVVRLHFRDVPMFMAVNSVLTQYVYSGGVTVNGATGVANGFDADSVGGSANLRYIERPTITFSPMSGPEFAAQMLTPIPTELVFTLISSGWPARDLLDMTLQRVNELQNIPFEDRHGDAALVASPEFTRVVELIVELARAGALEVQRDVETNDAYLILLDGASLGVEASVGEFRELVGLAGDISRFRIVENRIGRERDEVTVRVRSLLALMGILARGVDVLDPSGHTGSSPLAVRSSEERPSNAFVSVEYRGRWYSIADDDVLSREAFSLLNYLFLMMASRPDAGGPLLTLPVS
ncbi:MAG: hypothetical protein AAGA20_04320 [Planctomycetota bacterium]